MKKGTIFTIVVALLLSGLFGQTMPVKAATVAQTDSYLKLAEAAARKLAPQITYKENTALKDPDLKLFVQTRDNLNKTKSALKTLSPSNQQKFTTRIKYVQTIYDRSVSFRTALYNAKVITNAKNSFVSKHRSFPFSSDTEKAYNDLIKRTNETITIFNKVYDNQARAAFIAKYLKPAQAAVLPYVQTTLPLKKEIENVTNEVSSLEKAIGSNQPQALDKLYNSIQTKLSNLKHPETVVQLNQRLQKIRDGYQILSEKDFEEWSIQEMELDEQKGYIYLLSKHDDKVYVVSTNDLRIVKEVTINNPSDLELYEGQLYVAASPSVILDPVTLTTKPISTPLPNIHKFIMYKGHMYFGLDGPGTIKDFDIKTGKITEVIKEGGSLRDYSINVRQMVMDKEHGVLYVKDYSHIIAIDLDTYDILTKDNFNNGNGISYNGRLLYDSGDIFFYRYRMDANDLTTIHGRYENNEYHNEVMAIKDNFIFTEHNVFDRETYREIRKLPLKEIDLMQIDSSRNIYSFYYNKLTKFRVNVFPDETKDIEKAESQIKVEKGITDWVYDKNNEKIYAISKATNKLFFIDAKTYNVEKEVFVGAQPIDIQLHNGKIYVALFGAHKIAVVPTNIEGPISYIKTVIFPGQIVVNDKGIFYCDVKGSDSLKPIYMYDFATGNTSNLLTQIKSSNPLQTFYWRYMTMIMDPYKSIMYINNYRGQTIYAVNTETWEVVDQSSSDAFLYRDGTDMLVDKDNFYHIYFVTQKDDLSTYQVRFEQPVVYVGDDYVFTKGIFYKKSNYEKLGFFKENLHSAHVNDNKEVFLLNEDQTVLTKYESLEKVPQTPNP